MEFPTGNRSEFSSHEVAQTLPLRMRRLTALFAALIGNFLALSSIVSMAADAVPALPPAAARSVDFATDIQPLFQRNCFSCHGPEHQEGGLRLDQKQRALLGGDSGAEIAPGKSAESRLVR